MTSPYEADNEKAREDRLDDQQQRQAEAFWRAPFTQVEIRRLIRAVEHIQRQHVSSTCIYGAEGDDTVRDGFSEHILNDVLQQLRSLLPAANTNALDNT